MHGVGGEMTAIDGEARRLRVFVAEDDDEMRAMIADVLRRDGHLVFEARDGSALSRDLACALGGPPAHRRNVVVVSDLQMPERDGLSVLRGLRYQGECPPFILMTGFGDQHVHDEAARLFARAVLDKPFEMEELRRVLREIGREVG